MFCILDFVFWVLLFFGCLLVAERKIGMEGEKVEFEIVEKKMVPSRCSRHQEVTKVVGTWEWVREASS